MSRRTIARQLLKNRTDSKVGKTKGVEPSIAIEVRERTQIRGLIKLLEERVDATVMPILVNNAATYTLGDAKFVVDEKHTLLQDQSFVDEIALALAALRAQFLQLERLYIDWATEMANSTNAVHRAQFVADIDDAIGVNVQFLLNPARSQILLDSSIRNNANLISSVPQQAIDQIENTIMEGIRTGEQPQSIRRLLTERYSVADSRAKLIARDQVSKLSGSLSRVRQDDIGVTEFIWRTSRDERVRPTHRANSNKKFSWDKPPAKTGPPGHDIQCRCVAEPVLDHLLA